MTPESYAELPVFKILKRKRESRLNSSILRRYGGGTVELMIASHELADIIFYDWSTFPEVRQKPCRKNPDGAEQPDCPLRSKPQAVLEQHTKSKSRLLPMMGHCYCFPFTVKESGSISIWASR
jgi:hypothetical protein